MTGEGWRRKRKSGVLWADERLTRGGCAVTEARDPIHVGIKGVVVRETEKAFYIITQADKLRGMAAMANPHGTIPEKHATSLVVLRAVGWSSGAKTWSGFHISMGGIGSEAVWVAVGGPGWESSRQRGEQREAYHSAMIVHSSSYGKQDGRTLISGALLYICSMLLIV